MNVNFSINVAVIFIAILNLICIITMKFNDFKHIEEDVTEIKKDVKESIIPKIFNLIDRISRVEGKLNGK